MYTHSATITPGSLNQNREPLPGSESTPIRPPSCSMILWQIASPNPGSIRVGYQMKGEELEFYVQDTGIGIDKEQQLHIFERFVYRTGYSKHRISVY